MIPTNDERDKLKPVCWLKNNKDWFYPTKKIDLWQWDCVEVISFAHNHDLIYAWNFDQKELGRLYRTNNH